MGNQARPHTFTKKTFESTQEAGRGTLILVLGILSIVLLGPLSGIPAWIMGRNDLEKIEMGLIPESEKSATKIGKILGIIGTVLVIAMILLGIIMVVGINIIVFEASSTSSTVAF